MRKICFFLWGVFFQYPLFSQCPAEALAVLSPFTSQTECAERWKEGNALLVLERDCVPCQKMVGDLIKGESRFQHFKIQAVLLENEPRECLKESLKLKNQSGFEIIGCTQREMAQKTWQIEATPTLFWTEKKENKIQVGAF